MAVKNGGFLDMDKFTFCGRVIQAISEMIMEDTIQGPDINSIHTVFPDIVTPPIVTGKQIGRAHV